jgi:hypothetical protein
MREPLSERAPLRFARNHPQTLGFRPGGGEYQGPGGGAYQGEERRRKPRIYVDFPVRIWSVAVSGKKLELEVPSENLSASGLCVRLPCEVEVGEEIMILVRFSKLGEETRPRVAACGTVVRSARSPGPAADIGDVWETAIRFVSHVVV